MQIPFRIDLSDFFTLLILSKVPNIVLANFVDSGHMLVYKVYGVCMGQRGTPFGIVIWKKNFVGGEWKYFWKIQQYSLGTTLIPLTYILIE